MVMWQGSELSRRAGQRLERWAIKSPALLSLAGAHHVIAFLARKEAHVSCKNSKLTQLLQDSLGNVKIIVVRNLLLLRQ